MFFIRNYYWEQKIWSLPLPIKSRGEKIDTHPNPPKGREQKLEKFVSKLRLPPFGRVGVGIPFVR